MFDRSIAPSALSLDVLDISGTNENDASFSKAMNVHKRRMDRAGKWIGKAEYITPQSQVRPLGFRGPLRLTC